MEWVNRKLNKIFKRRHIGKFKGCLRKIIKLGNKTGPIRNRVFSDRYTNYIKRREIIDNLYQNKILHGLIYRFAFIDFICDWR